MPPRSSTPAIFSNTMWHLLFLDNLVSYSFIQVSYTKNDYISEIQKYSPDKIFI